MSLNKEYSLAWISHIKDVLWICCKYLDDLRPEFPMDMCTILLYLHTLVAFTSTNTWALLKAKHMEVLKPGMNQLCANVMGHLFTKGFYLALKVPLQVNKIQLLLCKDLKIVKKIRKICCCRFVSIN